MKEAAAYIYWLMREQAGCDPRRFFRSCAGMFRYIPDWWRFRRSYKGKLTFLPCLQDWSEQGGTAKGDYFLQDIHVAQKIYHASPEKHVDVGSRIDGFVAHVASFREIEVFDIRPVKSVVPGIVFRQADFMDAVNIVEEYCDSLSCLHALEHFGLGRYGDPVHPEGHLIGLRNMARMLKSGGTFYLSVPVGQERVQFNAQRIIHPCSLLNHAREAGLKIREFSFLLPGGTIETAEDIDETVNALINRPYALGIFTFVKL